MVEQQKSDAQSPETLAVFWQRLRDEGVSMGHIRAMLDRVNAERAEATAEAARLFFQKSGSDEPIPLNTFVDKLDDIARRCWGLVAALRGLAEDHGEDRFFRGVSQMASDNAFEMERLLAAFSSELTIEHTKKRDRAFD